MLHRRELTASYHEVTAYGKLLAKVPLLHVLCCSLGCRLRFYSYIRPLCLLEFFAVFLALALLNVWHKDTIMEKHCTVYIQTQCVSTILSLEKF